MDLIILISVFLVPILGLPAVFVLRRRRALAAFERFEVTSSKRRVGPGDAVDVSWDVLVKVQVPDVSVLEVRLAALESTRRMTIEPATVTSTEVRWQRLHAAWGGGVLAAGEHLQGRVTWALPHDAPLTRHRGEPRLEWELSLTLRREGHPPLSVVAPIEVRGS